MFLHVREAEVDSSTMLSLDDGVSRPTCGLQSPGNRKRGRILYREGEVDMGSKI